MSLLLTNCDSHARGISRTSGRIQFAKISSRTLAKADRGHKSTLFTAADFETECIGTSLNLMLFSAGFCIERQSAKTNQSTK